MHDEERDTHYTNDTELPTALKSRTPEQPSSGFPQPNMLGSEMYLPALVTQCLREIDHDRQGKPCTDNASVELFRRAIVENDPAARFWVQYCFSGLARGWLHRHPQREEACRLQIEETYIALAFERFWQASTSNQRLAFNRLEAALHNLLACLHGVIMETLRAHARQLLLAFPTPGEPLAEESPENCEAWEVLKTMLPNPCERRLAYLLFHCGLGPRDIIRLCPQEWRSVDEISELRCIIVGRFLRHVDHLRWRLG